MNSKSLTFLVILCIALVGTFGIFTFETMGSGNVECPFEILSGNTCSSVSGAFAMTLHHIEGFQSLMQSVLSTNINIALVLLITLFFTFSIFAKLVFQVFLEYKALLFKIFRTDKKIQANRMVDVLRKWSVLIRNKDFFSYAMAYDDVSM